MYPLISGDDWEFPFNQLRLRTWRDTARYMYEGMKNEDIGLPMLIELTFERWETAKKRPNFKAEDFVHKNSTKALEAAARVAAERLKLSHDETGKLVQRYLGYTRELSGPGIKPVPNFLSIHGIDDDTVTLQRCERVTAAIRQTRSRAEGRKHFPRRRHPLLGLDQYTTAARYRDAGRQALARRDHEWLFSELKKLRRWENCPYASKAWPSYVGTI